MADIHRAVYKTVAKVDGKLVSAIAWSKEEICVEYAIGVVSRPRIRNSCLFAFETQNRAESFRGHHHAVLYCDATLYKVQTIRMVADLDDDPIEIIRNFWKFLAGKTRVNPIMSYNAWPVLFGTVLCKTIKPISLVTP